MDNVSDTYQHITNVIIEQLEAGTKPWVRPWRGNTLTTSIIPRRSSGEAYRGINVLMLWIASQMNGYEDTIWMTYRQAKDLGGQVRKGERGSLVVKYGTFTPKDHDADDDRSIPYLKGYTVFNVEQIENLPTEYYSPAEPLPTTPVPHNETVDTFVRQTGAVIHYGGTKACYRPGPDDILMPDRVRFLSDVHLYSSLLHEIGHWSGAKHRLNRDLSGRFGSNAYAVEELVAELSAAFLCADLGVAHDLRENTAAYIDNWLAVLKADKRAIITAAAKAQAATDYLHGLVSIHRTEVA
ncbi:zincin-like metallopeptidase domain-containing protein [Ochrobactrum sp. 3-3]|uniref:ArdC family protein n=1 Tax=Ochrobactrum sp. 3-3 TaxID=1830124 RepID=UPI000DEFB0DB|nr:zincin-like metallopeptidase domain-containing protein [Ochrobactrum sp. 3-3]